MSSKRVTASTFLQKIPDPGRMLGQEGRAGDREDHLSCRKILTGQHAVLAGSALCADVHLDNTDGSHHLCQPPASQQLPSPL